MKKLIWLNLLLWSCFVTAADVRFIVSVPANTPSDARLSLGGDFNGWNPANPRYRMEKLPSGKHQYIFKNVKAGTVLNFKVTRGNWKTVEIEANGSNSDNRAYPVTNEDQTIEADVAAWADLTTKEAPSTVVGKVVMEQIELPTYAGNRQIRIYLPPDYATSDKRYPVIYMTDGQNLYDKKTANAGEWQMDELMKKLHQQRSPITSIVVGIDHAGENRRMEYLPFQYDGISYKKQGDGSPTQGKGEQFADWLALTLKPDIDKRYRTKPEREQTTMIGSSMGGLITCYTVLKHQEVFSKAACLSSAFLKRLVDDHWLSYIEQTKKRLPTKFYMDIGDNEFGLFGDDILDETAEVKQYLLQAGFDPNEVNNQVIRGGTHDEQSWRARLLPILKWLQQ